MHRHAARRPLRLEHLEDRSVPTTAAISAGILTVTGTPGADTIIVRRANNVFAVDGTTAAVPAGKVSRIVVNAGSGNDIVWLNSQDTRGQQAIGVPASIYGGNGDDTVYGTGGPDGLYGENGNDILLGGSGNDTFSGGNGNDWIAGDDGDDYLLGDYGGDRLTGGNGNDVIYGGADDDVLIGGSGRDVFNGGAGVNSYQDDYASPNPAAGAAGVTRAIAALQTGDVRWADLSDIHQQLGNTCSLLASLASYARTCPTDLAARISYDSTAGQYLVPLFVNNAWQQVRVSFDGNWTDNEPNPGDSATDGSRDYWVLLYQRAYLQALNVNAGSSDANQWSVRGTLPTDVNQQTWRYPDVALRTVTGGAAAAQSVSGDADMLAIAASVRAGRNVIANTQTVMAKQNLVTGTGLVFSHTYTVLDADPQTRTVTLRNPWGSDGLATSLTSLAPGARASFTQGNVGDGVVSIRWDVFVQAFATYVIA